jgi:hypothetical protein
MKQVSMKQVWRYVKEVEKGLPHARRVLIAGEIHATLKGRVEARGRELGRKLTDDEVAAVIAAFGPPAETAKRYAEAAGPSAHPMVDRYLDAVSHRLPDAQRHDVLAELREAIGDRLEAKAAERGEAASDADVAAVLKDFGSPMLAAARYRGRSHVIGPDLYPYFWPTQRLVVGLAAALAIIGVLARSLASAEPMQVVWRVWGAAWDAGLLAFGLVTLVFIVMERTGAAPRFEAHWSPLRLPAASGVRPKTLFDSLFALIFDALFIAWWVGVLKVSDVVPPQWGAGDAARLALSPAWDSVSMLVLGLALAQAATHLADVFHPAWSRARSVVVIACAGVGLYVLAVLAQAGPLVELVGGDGDAEREARVARIISTVGFWSLGVAAAIWAIQALVEVGRLARSIRGRVAEAQGRGVRRA